MKFFKGLLLLFFALAKNSNSLNLKNNEKNTLPINQIDNHFELSEGPIYSQGWYKFSKYKKNSLTKPTNFIKNPAYYIQTKLNPNLDIKLHDKVNKKNKKYQIGFINIPNDDFYFATITENSLNLLTSRNVSKFLT